VISVQLSDFCHWCRQRVARCQPLAGRTLWRGGGRGRGRLDAIGSETGSVICHSANRTAGAAEFAKADFFW